jgi:hypothetical protein
VSSELVQFFLEANTIHKAKRSLEEADTSPDGPELFRALIDVDLDRGRCKRISQSKASDASAAVNVVSFIEVPIEEKTHQTATRSSGLMDMAALQ